MKIRRGDVVLADYSHSLTGDSFRPVLVIQADGYNQSLTNTVVAQITRTLKRADDPAHFFIDVSTPEGKQAGLLHNSVVSCYNLNTVNAQRVHRVVGAVSQGMMQKIDDCLKAALGLR
ncbi:MAG: type II toxin-antitoxin system PemK/MazF family toxin [Thermoguttaceae bacterium]